MTILEISHIGLWILAILTAPLCIALIYLLSMIEQRAGALHANTQADLSIKVGDVFPSFVSRDLASGVESESIDLFRGGQRIFVAVQSGCPACTAIASELKSWRKHELARWGLVIVCFSSDDDCTKGYGTIESVPILKGDASNRVLAEAGLPTAFVVSADGIVSSIFVGASSFREVIDQLPAPSPDIAPSMKPVMDMESGSS